jgi:hypothetical protein
MLSQKCSIITKLDFGRDTSQCAARTPLFRLIYTRKVANTTPIEGNLDYVDHDKKF